MSVNKRVFKKKNNNKHNNSLMFILFLTINLQTVLN